MADQATDFVTPLAWGEFYAIAQPGAAGVNRYLCTNAGAEALAAAAGGATVYRVTMHALWHDAARIGPNPVGYGYIDQSGMMRCGSVDRARAAIEAAAIAGEGVSLREIPLFTRPDPLTAPAR